LVVKFRTPDASAQIASHLRSAVSPWFDCRTPIDLMRNRIEERALAL
jgi:hypothetical protein